MNAKTWLFLFLIGSITVTFVIGSITYIIDPYFHYHAPLENIQYTLTDERYINDGIAKHFKYNAVITGTSMTENFKTSEFQELFGYEAIKIPESGECYKEINRLVEIAMESGNDVQYVIRCLDYTHLLKDKDALRYDRNMYPWYLYNDNIFDDMEYLLNKRILCSRTIPFVYSTIQNRGGAVSSFDDYSNWSRECKFGKAVIAKDFIRAEKSTVQLSVTQDEKDMLLANIRQNVTDVADKYPDTDFYYFFPPYNFWYWDALIQEGRFYKQLEIEKIAIEEILRHPNIKLFSFDTRFSMTCNLENYKDTAHYGEWVNSKILQWMKEGQYLLTEDNYEHSLSLVRDFYESFDFDTYFEYEQMKGRL